VIDLRGKVMAYRKSVERRLDKKEKSESEQLIKVKRSEEYEVLEEVFDVNERFQRCQT
jgi:hypothetical protein